MKKYLAMLALACTAVVCLAACGGNDDGIDYDAFNTMLHADYSQIVLTVTDTFDEDTALQSQYTIEYTESGATVRYTVEKFAEASLDNPSASVKTTYTGRVVVEGGKITSTTGDDIGLSPNIAETGLVFKKGYFSKFWVIENSVIADVKFAAAFMGTALSCTDMKLEATFDEVFSYIRITYTSAIGSSVVYRYDFTV